MTALSRHHTPFQFSDMIFALNDVCLVARMCKNCLREGLQTFNQATYFLWHNDPTMMMTRRGIKNRPPEDHYWRLRIRSTVWTQTFAQPSSTEKVSWMPVSQVRYTT
jgi:hypothetical protein